MKKNSFFQSIVCAVFLLSLCLACNSEIEDNSNPIEFDPKDEEETMDSTAVQQKIIWKNWYLSVPIDAGDGKSTVVGYEQIINNELTDEESEYFYVNNDSTYTMWTKFTGFTSSGFSELGDKYCRTELREYWQGNQDVKDNWSMSSGVHILETTMTVDFVEGTGRTIIAQIHGKESDGITGNPATVKIRWNSGMIQVDYYTQPQNGEPWTSAYDNKIDFGRVDNELFTFKMKIEEGKLYCGLVCEAKDLNIEYTEFYDYVSNGYVHENYFKTGNYFAWNEDYEQAAQVTLHSAITDHY